MESVCAKGKEKGRVRCGREGERKEERMKKKEKKRGEEEKEEEKNRENGTKSVSPSPNAFPSTKLGNNITPINGRLGKNTTPISRDPTELSQNPQADPLRRQPSLDPSFRADFSYAPEGAEYSKFGLHSNGATIYKKVKALGNSRNRSQFSMNQH